MFLGDGSEDTWPVCSLCDVTPRGRFSPASPPYDGARNLNKNVHLTISQ